MLDPAASNDWDGQDVAKLTPATQTYATLAWEGTRDGEDILKAQEARPLADGGFTVALTLDVVGGAADLVLRWAPEDLPSTQVTLVDLETGDRVDLHAQSAYAFTGEASQGAASGAVPSRSAKSRAGQRRFLLAVGQQPVDTQPEAEPRMMSLGAPVPNPTRGAVRIPYALASSGEARVAVYDALGREVAVLASGEHRAGRHEATLDARGFAPGVYVVRLSTPEDASVQRITVVR